MPQPLKPPALKPGATIGVAAVSGPVDEQRLDRGLARLAAKGYRIVEASNLRRRDGFLAGSDAERAEGYRRLVVDPRVDAIFFARGGYGASRVLSRLDADEIRSHPKIHLGGSDLTALFAYISRAAGLVTFYGPMVAVEIAQEDELDWEGVLTGAALEPHHFDPADVLAPGEGTGTLAGGCLSLLASLAGTPEAVRGEGAILFWEDIGEETYRLDRMLTQLERSDTFDRLRGMLIGSLAPGQGASAPSAETLREWLSARLTHAPFPVAMGFPAGHLPRPRTLPLGLRVRLDLADQPALDFSGPCVETS